MDTWILSKIYLTELELIKQEEKEFKGKSDPTDENSDEMTDLYTEMFTE